jgi:alkylhydroperoxidase family enzyme
MRLKYTDNPPSFETVEDNAILDRVIARRGGKLIPLDRTLLHAPLITDGWNSFMVAIRTKNSLPADVRELAFCRVIALTKAWYEWEIHTPIARQAGLKGEVLAVIEPGTPIADDGNILDERQRAVVTYADAVSLDAVVPEDVFAAVRRFFSDKDMVELTASIAGFNTVARFVTALDVGEINGGDCPERLSFRALI